MVEAGSDLARFVGKALGTVPEDAVGLLGGDYLHNLRIRNLGKITRKTEEILRMRMDAPALLEQAGVEVSLNTDDWITDSRLLRRTAAIAMRHGLSRDGALRAITLTAAKHLGLDDRVGSLEPGKDADLVVLSGDPLSTYTRVLETWVEGQQVYDASNPEHAKYDVGGWHVYNPSPLQQHDGCLR